MIGWGDILTADQIRQLVAFIRQLGGAGPAPTGGLPSFQTQVLPLLQSKCGACHGTLGGWDASGYESVITSGDNGPAVLPGEAQDSLLAQKLLGTQSAGGPMPPGGGLAQEEIQLILDWITGGAPDN
jgi:mono/diheme cytochrome c family protein